jgi:carbon monoxide dehydrogenase subunit G
VVAPIDTVWDTLMDFERVAGCLPGARILNKLSDDAYQVGMSVKLGPVSMEYKGLLNVIERNAAEHRAVLGGKAQETRGQGTAEATVTLTLTEEGDATRGSVSADLALSGKAAAMGKGVIGSVTEQMMALFANNLQAMLAEGAPPVPEQGPETSSAAAPAPAAQAVPEPVPASAAVSAPAAGTTAAAPTTVAPTAPATAMAGAPAGAAPAGSLDALSLAKGIAADQLSNPATVLGVVAVVACIAYWAGRRSAFRMLRQCGRL